MLTKVFAGLVILISLALAGAAWSGAFSSQLEEANPAPTQIQSNDGTSTPAEPACCPSTSELPSCCGD